MSEKKKASGGPRKSFAVSSKTYELLLSEKQSLERHLGLSVGWSDFLAKVVTELRSVRATRDVT